MELKPGMAEVVVNLLKGQGGPFAQIELVQHGKGHWSVAHCSPVSGKSPGALQVGDSHHQQVLGLLLLERVEQAVFSVS